VLLRALQMLGAVWTSPNTLIGLAAGTTAMLAGARPSWNGRDCAVVFREFPWGPGGAITLGNVILHTGPVLDVPCRTYAHQAGHATEPVIGLHDHVHATRSSARPMCTRCRAAGGGHGGVISALNPCKKNVGNATSSACKKTLLACMTNQSGLTG